MGLCNETDVGLALVLFAALSAAAPAGADATKGAQLVRQWCVNCHVIGGSAVSPVQEGPPNLATITQELTPEQLRAFLSNPHPPMPNPSLTRSEIDDLISYIRTLR